MTERERVQAVIRGLRDIPQQKLLTGPDFANLDHTESLAYGRNLDMKRTARQSSVAL